MERSGIAALDRAGQSRRARMDERLPKAATSSDSSPHSMRLARRSSAIVVRKGLECARWSGSGIAALDRAGQSTRARMDERLPKAATSSDSSPYSMPLARRSGVIVVRKGLECARWSGAESPLWTAPVNPDALEWTNDFRKQRHRLTRRRTPCGWREDRALSLSARVWSARDGAAAESPLWTAPVNPLALEWTNAFRKRRHRLTRRRTPCRWREDRALSLSARVWSARDGAERNRRFGPRRSIHSRSN